MGYQIDVAFDMRIVGSMTNLYDMFVKKAEKNNCEMYYMNYEFDGIGRNIVRNHSVMSFFFPPEESSVPASVSETSGFFCLKWNSFLNQTTIPGNF